MINSKPPLLVVRPASTGTGQGGDEVMYRKTLPYLAQHWDVDVLELQPVGKLRKFANLLTITPPECTRFLSGTNRALVRERLATRRYAAVLLINEVTFVMLPEVKRAGVPAILQAQNVHSLVAETDPSPLARAMRPIAIAYERRLYADPAAKLICISQVDAQAIKRSTGRSDFVVAPPGAPPSAPLAADAPILGEAVLTGSYDWWRKRRDLTTFAAVAPVGLPIYASDPQARAILGDQAQPLDDNSDFWSQGLRFGLVTDIFIGGFKLKSLEYVAKNCIVLSMSNIGIEFAGLPNAEEFVRHTQTMDAARAAITELRAGDNTATVARFLEFKAACLDRFSWSKVLEPVGKTIEATIT